MGRVLNNDAFFLEVLETFHWELYCKNTNNILARGVNKDVGVNEIFTYNMVSNKRDVNEGVKLKNHDLSHFCDLLCHPCLMVAYLFGGGDGGRV